MNRVYNSMYVIALPNVRGLDCYVLMVPEKSNQASKSLCRHVVVCIGRACSTDTVTLFVPGVTVPLFEGSMRQEFGTYTYCQLISQEWVNPWRSRLYSLKYLLYFRCLGNERALRVPYQGE